MEVTLYSPHRNQLKIHNSIENEPYKYYVLNIGRQFGKSLLATNQLLKWCLSDNDCKAAWVSPIYKQAKKVFDEIDTALSNTGLVIERNKQEYLAEFIDGGAGLFLDMNYTNDVQTSSRYYAGIDLGRADDYTVLTIFNEIGQMVYCDRWRQNSWANIVNQITNKLNEYQAYAMVEVNSIGDAIFEQIQNNINFKDRLEAFVTTSKSKQDIIEQLMVGNQNKEVTFLDRDWLRKEFEVFTYEYNPKTKSIKYSAPNGFHDDGVMSTAIAYNCYKQSKLRGVYHIA